MKVNLIVKQDLSLGELGFWYDGVPQHDNANCIMQGNLLAHDIIEHQRGLRNIGSAGDEMLALGAAYFVRGWSGAFSKDYSNGTSVEKNLAADLENVLINFDPDYGYEMVVPRTRSSVYDDVFDEVLNHVKVDPDDLSYDFDAQAYKQFKRDALHFMRRGAALAKKRFGRSPRAWDQFWAIADAVDGVAKSIEYEGQRFALHWGGGDARCEEVYEEGW